jgi:hypothetical protein
VLIYGCVYRCDHISLPMYTRLSLSLSLYLFAYLPDLCT